MATNDDDVFRPTDEASIALLRGLRTKTIADHSFIHHADVCSAAPDELVADLQPVPGTDVTEDGYNSVWYLYCPKRYKNNQGKAGGHRQRAVEPDGKTCWHSEGGPKNMKDMPGATLCNFSYGCKDGASGRRFDRMGWCMTEFDDTQGGGGDHVLCRVHRSSSSLAKRKFKSSSSSKRKAAGDHPEAPPTKLIHDEQVQMQMQVVQQNSATFFTNAYPTIPYYGYGPSQSVDPVMMVGGEDERGVLQPVVEPEYGGDFNLDELINNDEQVQMMVQKDPAPFTNAYPTTTCYGYGPPQGVDDAVMTVGGEEDRGVQVQQPRVELEAEHGGEFNLDGLINNDEQVQMMVQKDPAPFTNAYPTTPCYGYGPPEGVDDAVMTTVGGEEDRGVQQPRVELEAEHVGGGEFNVEEFLNKEEFTNAYSTTTMGGPQGVDPVTMLGGQEEEHGVQQPRVESEAQHGSDLGGFNLEELLDTDDWKGFLQMLQAEVEKEQQQQPSADPEQGGGIVISGSLLYAC